MQGLWLIGLKQIPPPDFPWQILMAVNLWRRYCSANPPTLNEMLTTLPVHRHPYLGIFLSGMLFIGPICLVLPLALAQEAICLMSMYGVYLFHEFILRRYIILLYLHLRR